MGLSTPIVIVTSLRRNKIQSSKTLIETINNGKVSPASLVKIALKDLEALEKLLEKNDLT